MNKLMRVFLVFTLLLAGVARADDSYYWQAFGGHTGPTALAACQSIDTAPGHKARVEGPGYYGNYVCYIDYPAGSSPPLTGYGDVVEHGTPPATPPVTCTKGDTMNVRDTYASEAALSQSHIPTVYKGCKVEVTKVLQCAEYSEGPNKGKAFCDYMVTVTGTSTDTQPSSVSDVPSPSDASSRSDTKSPSIPATGGSCPGGTVQAGVDSSGIPMCIGTGTDPVAPTAKPTTSVSAPVTATNSDGSTTTTTTTMQTNSDGSKTVTNDVTTVGADGSTTKSQTVSVTPATSGSAGQTDSQSSSFCKDNPNLTVCQNSTVSGSCESTSCTGDAIQCATLRAAATMQCAMKADTDAMKASSSSSLGNSLLNGADPLQSQIDDAKKGTTVDLSDPKIDQNGFLGGGSCLADKTFTILGKSTTVSFSAMCERIQPLRYGMVLVGMIVAYFIVSRSVLKA